MAYVDTSDDSMKRYKRLEKLGEGTYGLVYKARDLTSDKIVAIKKIKLDNNEEGIPATTMREISLLSHISHPNIVDMSGCIYAVGELYLIFEFMACDLKGYVDSFPHDEFMSTYLLKKFSYFLVEGIRYCHARRILHRDLKPQNILVSSDLDLKIADFGLGREHGLPIDELTHEVVTLWYRPPEILLGKKKYSGACDVWGLGCIIAEMATKVPLLPGDSEIDQLYQIYRLFGTPTNEIWPGIVDLPDYKAIGPRWKKKDLAKELNGRFDDVGVELMEKVFTYPPNKRITAKKMLVDPWFDEVRAEMIQMFGNTYPHCGSKAYQLRKFKKEQEANANAENVQPNAEEEGSDYDDDDDINVNKQQQQKGGKKRQSKRIYAKKQKAKQNAKHDSDNDDDDDITSNAEEWAAVNGKRNH